MPETFPDGRILDKIEDHDHQKLDVCIGCLMDDQIELFWHSAAPLAQALLFLEKQDLHALIQTLPLEPDEAEAQIDALQDIEHADEFPDSKPQALGQQLWNLVSNEHSHCYSHSERLGQIEILTAILSMDLAAQYLQSGNVPSCFASCSRAHMHLGMASYKLVRPTPRTLCGPSRNAVATRRSNKTLSSGPRTRQRNTGCAGKRTHRFTQGRKPTQKT